MVVTRCPQVLLQLGSVVLPHVLLVYSGRRLSSSYFVAEKKRTAGAEPSFSVAAAIMQILLESFTFR